MLLASPETSRRRQPAAVVGAVRERHDRAPRCPTTAASDAARLGDRVEERRRAERPLNAVELRQNVARRRRQRLQHAELLVEHEQARRDRRRASSQLSR